MGGRERRHNSGWAPRGRLRGPIQGKAEASLRCLKLLPTPLAGPGRVLRNGGTEVTTGAHDPPSFPPLPCPHVQAGYPPLSPRSRPFSEKEFMKGCSDGLTVCLGVKGFLCFAFRAICLHNKSARDITLGPQPNFSPVFRPASPESAGRSGRPRAHAGFPFNPWLPCLPLPCPSMFTSRFCLNFLLDWPPTPSLPCALGSSQWSGKSLSRIYILTRTLEARDGRAPVPGGAEESDMSGGGLWSGRKCQRSISIGRW